MQSDLHAVLFDMDGTLVHSEPLWMKSELAFAEEANCDWTLADGVEMVGRSLHDAATYIRERMNLRLEPHEIVDRMVADMVRELSQEIPWQPGAIEVLHELHDAGVKLALVTMSYAQLASIIADEVGLFSAVISGDIVTRGKPFPDPYLQAAELLGVDPKHTIAVEDSHTGVTSALAAGCTTIVVPGYAPVDKAVGHAHWEGLVGRSVSDFHGVWRDSVSS